MVDHVDLKTSNGANPVADLDGSGADVFVCWVDVFGGIDIDDDG